MGANSQDPLDTASQYDDSFGAKEIDDSRNTDGSHWVAVWTAMPQLTEPENMPPAPFNQPNLTFHNSTIRQTLRISTGGQYIRIRVSNAFGLNDLPLTAVTVALPKAEAGRQATGSKAVHTDSIQILTFDSHQSVYIPGGAFVLSDPVNYPVQPAQVITVSIFLRHGQTGGQVTSHPGSRTQTWMSHGNHTMAEDITDPSIQSTFHWYFLSGVEIWQHRQNCALALIGDSITDGRCSTDNGNDRWADLLFNRMLQHQYAQSIAVINQAAGGNRILRDGKGPNVLARLDRDIFGQPGVRYVMVFHGVNDIGTAEADVKSQKVIGNQLIQAYKQIISRVHSFGIPIFCSTITPFSAPDVTFHPYAVATREHTRQRVNEWLRKSDAFDAVIDFDAVLRDPDNPSQLNPDYNSGDYLHPNLKAFQAMARAFPLDIFQRFANGVHTFY
ncbi:extracellular GDSL-like lipase/acylhydrolase [Xylogone sp. PMI_703]|nr:extracellular GDSL-like lipase/acylhydrolase [Xylogone sp. PMI_703]